MVSSSRIALALMLASSFTSAHARIAPDTQLARSGARQDARPPQPNPEDLDRATVPYVSTLNEGFDNITTLAANGWFLQNNSVAVGSTSWMQGPSVAGAGPFDAFDGAANAYIGANYNNTGSVGTISNWMLTPELNFGAGGTVTFYTRKPSPDSYADRLEIRSSTAGTSTNIGTNATSVGDFTTLRLSINPNLVLGVYPTTWTQYTITGLPHSGSGRIAFRYFVTNAGLSGSNSDFIGIDRVQYTAGPAEYQIGGTVSGLAGSGLTLKLNGTDTLTPAADGSFTFPSYITTGGSYAVTVTGQPTSLSQTCAVTNGNGTATTTVTNVQVTCTTNTYSVGGSVAGLAGSGLVLQVNGGQDLAIAADGSFSFPTALTDGSAYSVTVASQPTHLSQVCSATNASGTLAGANVATVQVTCVTNTFAVSANVNGLAGSGLVLQLNGGSDIPVSADGTFAFSPSLVDGSAYAVTVATQPGNLSQTCTVANANGTLDGSDVELGVTCTTNTFAVGGAVAGLAGSGLKLQLQNGTSVTPNADGAFTFPQPLIDGSAYAVVVVTQPSQLNQVCTVANDSGTIAGADVTNVQVTCVTNTYSVGGSVSGLAGSGLQLQLQNGSTVTPTADGTFTFPLAVDDGTAYTVLALTQPSQPTQTCTVTNGTGTVAGANVTNVQVSCTTNTYFIGGSVSGLAGSGLVLALNGAENLPVSANGSFLFPTAHADGTVYVVTVATQPASPSQTCSISNAGGTLAGSDVTNIAVTCTTNAHTVGGTVIGLDGTGLVLQLNGGDDLPISADGAFTFTQAIDEGVAFAVTVSVQPTGGLSTACFVRNGTGTMKGVAIGDVEVICDVIFIDGFEETPAP